MRKAIIVFVFLSGFLYSSAQTKRLITCPCGEYTCYCDTAGTRILDGKWKYALGFKNGFAFACNEKQCAYIDTTGKFECDCSFSYIGKFHNGYAYADRNSKANEILIINSNCETKFSKKHSPGEQSAAFFDSIIVIYTSGHFLLNYGAIDYGFNIVIPFDYCRMIKSSSDRYYIVAEYSGKGEEDCNALWGLFDIVERKEIVPCTYKEGWVNTGIGSTCRPEDAFYKELKKYNITWPDIDQISERINGIYDK